uniref:NADH-ubiquinone oxidoreductase chain 6 n=1 Tax=Iberoporus pluto TaxID=2811596 RepID=A0A894JWT9_9DYTI|nr:NADH dehydrogenase subunit 6 [Iberoporus pluto]QRV62735.1 NADH dehydrogenase subunit 6 [Iberoporus pluto]
MFLFIIIMNFYMTLIFLYLNHPLSMGLILLIQTLIISLITSTYSYSFWFSYILFIIMIGGMLILLMYMTSLASNEKFKFSTLLLYMMIYLIAIMLLMYMLFDNFLMNMLLKNSNLLEIFNKQFFKDENINSLWMMYNNPNNMITMILINYLFLTLIAVVKITKFNNGPLRQKF